jgi:hydroxymethylbilane synthase
VIASRESALAMWQARHIQSRLGALHPRAAIEILGVRTEGDRRPDAALARIGGKGLFVKELEEALASGHADLAVHSVKDVPATLAPQFVLAAISEREDPRDAFVSSRYPGLAALPAGARVGTSSLRRACQLRARYPSWTIVPLRGNVTTRLRKLDEGQCDAVILAAAGLKRLGLASRITQVLDATESVPAPGQGALGVECLTSRAELIELLAGLNHVPTVRCVMAERALSRALAGSCNVPLGAYAEANGSRLRLRGFVGAPDGSRVARGEMEGPAADPEALGAALAERLKAQGAVDILAQLQR